MYRAMIAQAVPGADPALVEAWMRVEHGTLDHMDRARFAREARLAAATAAEAGADLNDAILRSYGR